MPTWLSWEMLIATTGALVVAAGVVVCAWAVRKKPTKPYRRTLRFTGGTLLTIIGAYITLKKYIDDSGWAQWIESMLEWLIPLFGTTLMVVGVVVFFWAMWSDRARGRKRCPKCWYDMAAVPTLTCPECGKDARKPERLLHTRRQWRMAFLGLALTALGSTQFAEPWYRRGGWLPYIPTRVLIYAIPSFESNRSRWMWELDKRLVDGQTAYSFSGRRDLPRLKTLSPASLALLSRTAITTLENQPKHPAKQMLFELMPEFLQSTDAHRAEPIVFAALTDSDPRVRQGAIATLRHVKGFDSAKALNEVLTYVAGAGITTVQNDPNGYGEAAALLGDVGASDPRVVPALVSLLSANPRGMVEYDLNNDVLWALAAIGPAAASAIDKVRSANDFASEPLQMYTVLMLGGKVGGREEVLRFMMHTPLLTTSVQQSRRMFLGTTAENIDTTEFAIQQMGEGPATDATVTDLVWQLGQGPAHLRTAAADALLSLDRETPAATQTLQEIAQVAELAPWFGLDSTGQVDVLHERLPLRSVLTVYLRHNLDVAPIEERARTLFDKASAAAQLENTASPGPMTRQLASLRNELQTIMSQVADYRAGRLSKLQLTQDRTSRRR